MQFTACDVRTLLLLKKKQIFKYLNDIGGFFFVYFSILHGCLFLYTVIRCVLFLEKGHRKVYFKNARGPARVSRLHVFCDKTLLYALLRAASFLFEYYVYIIHPNDHVIKAIYSRIKNNKKIVNTFL